MKKRTFTAFLLIIIMLLGTMVPSAYAAELRDTEFFTDRYHTTLHFDEIEYRRIDVEPLLAEIDAVRELLSYAGNMNEVAERYDQLLKKQDEVDAMASIAKIRYCQNYKDTAMEEENSISDRSSSILSDQMSALARDILSSPCAAAAEKHFTPEEQAKQLEYAPKSEEQLALEARQLELVNMYWARSGDITVEYEARIWNEDSVYEAYKNEEVDKDTYKKIEEQIDLKRNEELGSIFLEMIELRRQIAALAGYDNYTEYAYKEIWGRDYTPQEIIPFHEAVKEYMAPLSQDMGEIYYEVLDGEAETFIYESDYSGDIAVEAVEPYLSRMSDELAEAFAYMRSHGLYDLEKSDLKLDQGFCTVLDGYGSLFIFNKPYGGVDDLQTLVHEFGHYNSGYWADPNFDKSSDICEVHSQGLELLFTEFYPELFGDNSDAAEFYLMDSMIYGSIVNGARIDELQQYAYATENVTLEQLNREYCRLSKEYGFIDADDSREELGTWVDVHHIFTRPCEYVCYAVSASGGFAFWLEAQEDYLSAVDHYLQLTALDTSYGFHESFDAVDMQSPISPEYVRELAGALRIALKVDDRIAAVREANAPFSDIDENAWYAEAVQYVYENELMTVNGEAAFGPNNAVSRGSLVEILYRMEGSPAVEAAAGFSDVAAEDAYGDAIAWAFANQIVSGYGDGTFRPEQLISREQTATVLWRYAQYKGIDVSVGENTNILSYDDAFDIAEYAIPAMQWACGSGAVCGKAASDGAGMLLDPDGETTRAQIAMIIMRFDKSR